MKKLLLILSMSLFIVSVYGQLANSSFESWNSTPYDEPTGWGTGNKESVSLGLIPVSRANGISGYAVRMQTTVSNGDTAQAYITNGDPMSGEGGVPFTEQPTAITGYYRYMLPGNDSAILIVLFKSGGNIISSDMYKFRGTGTQNTFTPFSFPLTVSSMPDSVIIAFASSNLIDNVGVQNGSFLEVDGIAFTGASSTIDNADFENWTTNTNDAIAGWLTYGDGFAKTTDSYEGAFAASLTTIDYGNGNIGNSGMTNGQFTQNGTVGGVPYTLTADTLTGYYKYSSSGYDSASISVSLTNNTIYVSGTGTYLPPTAQYTYFEIPIYAGSTPDTMRIDITSSKWPQTQNSVGSTLIIDNLQLKSTIALGIINDHAQKSTSVFTYPNPANEILHISLPKSASGNAHVEIYDLSGRLVMNEKKSVTDNNLEIQISSLTAGRYYFRLTSDTGIYHQAFTKN